MKLPIQFQVSEDAEKYVLGAYVPGLKLEDVQVSVSDGRRLVVTGVKYPSLEEEAHLAHTIRQRYGVEPSLEMLLRLGAGRYGAFREVFKLPDDVPADGVHATYKGGRLLVTLARAAPVMDEDDEEEVLPAAPLYGVPRRPMAAPRRMRGLPGDYVMPSSGYGGYSRAPQRPMYGGAPFGDMLGDRDLWW